MVWQQSFYIRGRNPYHKDGSKTQPRRFLGPSRGRTLTVGLGSRKVARALERGTLKKTSRPIRGRGDRTDARVRTSIRFPDRRKSLKEGKKPYRYRLLRHGAKKLKLSNGKFDKHITLPEKAAKSGEPNFFHTSVKPLKF